MRRTVVVLLLAGVMGRAASALDLPEVKQRGDLLTIIVGDPAEPVARPRFFVEQGGAPRGLEAELLVGFARLHGIRLQVVYVSSWADLIPALLAGKGDVIGGGINDTPDRRRSIAFTVETFPTRNVVVTRRPHRVVRTLEQLREERVGVQTGTAYVEASREAGVPPESLVLFDDAGSITEAMRSGKITATVEGIEMALAPQVDDPARQIGAFLGPPLSLALGVRKEDKQLLAALNEYIRNVRRTPSWNRLVVTYFGEQAVEILRRVRIE